ncbi:hypothetical protein [Streptomyces sp. BBFR2]
MSAKKGRRGYRRRWRRIRSGARWLGPLYAVFRIAREIWSHL